MKRFSLTLLAVTTFLGCALVTNAQDEATQKPRGLKGPAVADLGQVAQVKVPEGFIFLDGDQTRALMKQWGEPIGGNEVGFLRPTNGGWAVYFDYSETGYIKDDDKDKLDAPKLLKSLKEGTDEGNKERIRNGNAPLLLEGWAQEPKYDPVTHNLTWAIRMTSEGKPILNYNTRLLGRKGLMSVVLVCEPENLEATLPSFTSVLADYKFVGGQTYAEYKPGDKIAKYGLGALVLGGAAVGAAKLGMFAWLAVALKKAWKLVIIAVVAVAGFFKKLINKITGNRSES